MWSLLILALSAAPAPVYKVAAPGLSYVNLETKTGEFYLDYFTQQLSSHPGMQVTTSSEILATLGLARQKALLGCSAESCTAELAGALGVDALIVGSIAKAGGGFVANLKIISATDSSTVAVFSSRVKDEGALLDYLAASAAALAQKLAPPPEVIAVEKHAPAPAVESTRSLAWIPAAVVGAGLLGTGGALLGVAAGHANTLRTADGSIADFDASAELRRTGQSEQALGFALGGAGVLGLLNAGLLLALPTDAGIRRWLPGISGVLCAGAGAVLLGLAAGNANQVRAGGSLTYREALQLRADGQAEQTAAFGLLGAGVLGLAGSAVMFLTHSDPVQVSIVVLPSGASASARIGF